MNIFKLHENYTVAARMHNDKHIVKMDTEYPQLMSTAHRVLDGEEYYGKTANNRKIKRFLHPDAELESILYKASHINHPSGIWSRETVSNYLWLYGLWEECCKEYTYRYNKEHGAWTKLGEILRTPPSNIPDGPLTVMPQAMPDDVKGPDTVEAYRNYYRKYKAHFSKWTNRPTPEFMSYA